MTDQDFDPRTPCGVRLDKAENDVVDHIFQSTHPLRGATEVERDREFGVNISIHAPPKGAT